MALPPIPFQQFMSQDWQKYQQALATTELLQPVGSAINMAFASMKDYFADRVRLSIKAKLPGDGYNPVDALIQIGRERQINENPGESDVAFTARLQKAWQVWPYAGTHRGVLRALYDAGYPNVGIVQQLGGFYTITVDANDNTTLNITSSPRWDFDVGSPLANPTGWTAGTIYGAGSVVVPQPLTGYYFVTATGGQAGATPPAWTTSLGSIVQDNTVVWQCHGQDFWSRFAVIFFSPFPSSWGGTPPVDGSNEQIRVSNLIRQWKSAHSTCSKIVIPQAGALWGYPAPMTSGTWGSWRATWGTNTSPAPTYWTP